MTSSSSSSGGPESGMLQRVAAIRQQLTNVTRTTVASSPMPISQSLVKKRSEWKHIPSYRDLKAEGGHPGCAWDVWGRGYDQLGTVNLLTDAVVARSAREEIKTGHSFALNLPLHLPVEPFFMRQGLQHTFIPSTAPRWKEHRQAVAERHRQRGRNPVNAISAEDTTSDDAQHAPCTDEVLTANTQCSTHWDGLRHVGHTSLNVFYGGVPRAEIHDAAKAHNAHAHTSGVPPQRLHNPNLESPSSPALKLGMQNWATHGISGRGVLLDVWGYLSRKDLDRQRRGHHKVGYRFGPYDPCSTHTITLDDLKETAAAQGVRFRQGDILLIRMGFTTRYYNSKPSERTKWSISNAALHGSGHKFAGIESLHRMAAWLWDQHFAAIASDSPTLESWPPRQGFTSLHEQLLGFFGMPIGEMFDLEALTEHCVKNKRWTFHFVSWPSNLYGGVASPANAAAYF